MCSNPGKEKKNQLMFTVQQWVPPTLDNLLDKLRNINLREDLLAVHNPAVEVPACNKFSFLKDGA